MATRLPTETHPSSLIPQSPRYLGTYIYIASASYIRKNPPPRAPIHRPKLTQLNSLQEIGRHVGTPNVQPVGRGGVPGDGGLAIDLVAVAVVFEDELGGVEPVCVSAHTRARGGLGVGLGKVFGASVGERGKYVCPVGRWVGVWKKKKKKKRERTYQ